MHTHVRAQQLLDGLALALVVLQLHLQVGKAAHIMRGDLSMRATGAEERPLIFLVNGDWQVISCVIRILFVKK